MRLFLILLTASLVVAFVVGRLASAVIGESEDPISACGTACAEEAR